MNYSELKGRRAVLIAGPTAAGKSALAREIAAELGGVVVNSDSMQVYSCWRLLTARPSPGEVHGIPHLLYGHVDYDAQYSVGAWLEDAKRTLVEHPDRPLIFAGGTGLYFSALTSGLSRMPHVSAEARSRSGEIVAEKGIEALLDDLQKNDAETFMSIDKANPARIRRAWEVLHATGRGIRSWQSARADPILPLADTYPIVVHSSRERLLRRMEERIRLMVRNGALRECEDMMDRWDPSLASSKAIGAKEFMSFLKGKCDLGEAIAQTFVATRQYAKRQMTWFKGRMKSWNWLEAS